MSDSVQAPPSQWNLDRALHVAGQLAGFLAIVGTALFAIRVLFVAEFDFSVARALVVNSSVTSLILTVALDGVVLAFFAGLAVFFLRIFRRFYESRTLRGLVVLLAASGTFTIFSLLIAPENISLLLASTWNIFVIIMLVPPVPRNDVIAMIAVGVYAVLLLTGLTTAPWLPPERAVVDGVAKTIYVLDDSGSEYVVFDPVDHIVRRMPKTVVKERQYCAKGDLARPLLLRKIIGETKGLPECPKS